MRSSERVAATLFVALLLGASQASAQSQMQGFAVERLYTSAAGGGWFVMDDLSMHGGLGGAISLTGGYEHDPLRVATTDGSQRLAVVSDLASVNVGMAGTYDRFRLYIDFSRPITSSGESGTVGAYQLTAPGANPGTNPDTIADTRIGADVRLLGGYDDPFRLGLGVQLFVPSDNRADYDTDGTYRFMARALFAGDVARFTYAGQLGVHIRPLDDAPAPGSPEGSEMLFGVAAGAKMPVTDALRVVVGPEIFGETAFNSFLSTTGTGLEALLSGRIEETGEAGPQLRFKVGAGGGLNPHFGAPEWRMVFGVEVFDHANPPPARVAAQAR
jgi:hypothetical protein